MSAFRFVMATSSQGADEQQFANIFIGAETGLLKGVNVAKKTWRNVNEVSAASREKEIVSLCWADTQQKQVCLGLRDRTVQVYDTEKSEFTQSHSFLDGDGIFKGLYCQDNVFITCTESGLLRVWDSDDIRTEITVGPQICKMRQNRQQRHLVATGGKDNGLKIWDLESGATEPIFKAKNVKNDWLNLTVPTHVTDIAFLPDSDKVVTCTAYHQIRVYDPKTGQRRPVLDMEFDEYPFTSMGLRHGGNHIVVGNTHGKMAMMDIRGKGHMVHCYRGFAGSIRCVECHPTLPLVASCGLDRYLRVHDLEETHLLHKFYLKSRLNCLLFAERWTHNDKLSLTEKQLHTAGVNGKKSTPDEASSQENLEDERIWADMEVVTVKSKKRKTPTKLNDGDGAKVRVSGRRKKECGVTDETDLSTDVVKTKRKKKGRVQCVDDTEGDMKSSKKEVTRKVTRKKKKTA